MERTADFAGISRFTPNRLPVELGCKCVSSFRRLNRLNALFRAMSHITVLHTVGVDYAVVVCLSNKQIAEGCSLGFDAGAGRKHLRRQALRKRVLTHSKLVVTVGFRLSSIRLVSELLASRWAARRCAVANRGREGHGKTESVRQLNKLMPDSRAIILGQMHAVTFGFRSVFHSGRDPMPR